MEDKDKRRGEPVAWVAADTLYSAHPTCISSLAYMSQFDHDRGREYVPLAIINHHAAPQPAEPVKLECPKCGIDRAKSPCAGNLLECAFKGVAHATEPVKVPGLDDVERDATGETWMGMRVAAWEWIVSSPLGELPHHATHWSTGPKDAERLYRESDIRALLARYGQPAQPAASAEPIPEDALGRLYTGKATADDQMLAWRALQVAPVAQEPVAYRVLRKTLGGEWKSDGRDWCDGRPSADLVADIAKRSDGWRIEYAYATPVAPQAQLSGNSGQLPDGYVAIPRQPTEADIIALSKTLPEDTYAVDVWGTVAARGLTGTEVQIIAAANDDPTPEEEEAWQQIEKKK